MSRSRAQSSAKIQSWIRACKREGASGHSELFECVLEKRLDSGVTTINPPREEGRRIERQVARATGRPTRNPSTGRLFGAMCPSNVGARKAPKKMRSVRR